ncbi:MBOAT family protein [Lepidopterella palustris CBS 459.81]|uniref:MBOAT family protein n=1 Tax=Lepidopterella palustris CBS 459.81 TaxID=1314670 RepID=A0A8E2EBP5_9PEZI|nr:MBOAT family protein [Lepidopterella palustris CBS 459.81]
MLPYINIPFNYVGNALGASTDELKLIFSFLLSYPLAAVLKRIPDKSPWQKNLFIIGVGLFYLIGLFDLWDGLRTLMWSSVGAYAIAAYIDSPYMPWIGFVFCMGHMSLSHIQRQRANDHRAVDISGAQMVLVMKLTAFCWNVSDARHPDSELTDFQKERAIKKLPNLLDYAGYVLFFPSLMAGPAFDYVDYQKYISTTMFQLPPGTDPSKAPPTRKKRKIPRSGTPAALKAASGLAWIFAFLKFSSWYNPQLLLGPEYMKYGILRRIFILHMLGFTMRMKYYGVWTMTEGACILAGIGYKGIDPKTGQANWDRLQNVRPWDIETAQNTRAYLGNWNINTNLWLRNSMYLRVTPKGKKPGFRASLATFVTSAFWHGFYPGYYMAFVLASLLQTIAKNGRRLLRPFFLTPDGASPTPNKRYYDIACFFLTQLSFSFTVAPFIYLSFSDSMKVWGRVYFYCLVGVAISLGCIFSPLKRKLQDQLKKRNRGKIEEVVKEEQEKERVQQEPTLGLPDDPEAEVEEIVAEIKRDIEEMRKRGESVSLDIRKAVEEKLGKKLP